MLVAVRTRAHKRTNIMAASERETVSANDGVSSKISAMCAWKMAKCGAVWTLSNAFTRAKLPTQRACTRTPVIRTFREICSQVRMLKLEKCGVHKRNKRKNHANAKDKCIYPCSICRPPTMPLIKKLKVSLPPRGSVAPSLWECPAGGCSQGERWPCTKCSRFIFSSNSWKELSKIKCYNLTQL